jgi:hypothetical protein
MGGSPVVVPVDGAGGMGARWGGVGHRLTCVDMGTRMVSMGTEGTT